MNARPILESVSPRAIVLAALPVLFLLLPDGIPFIYAGCGTPATCCAANGPGVQRCTDCLDSDQVAIYRVIDCSVSATSGKCEITVTATLAVNQVGCVVKWKPRCGIANCGNSTAGTGLFNSSVSKTHGCVTSGDVIYVAIGKETGDGSCSTCTPLDVLVAQAICNQ